MTWANIIAVWNWWHKPIYMFVCCFFFQNNFSQKFVSLLTKKEKVLKASFNLYPHHLIVEFFWFAKLRFRFEEKLHAKAVAVSKGGARGGGGLEFWKLFWLREGDELPVRNVCLGDWGISGNCGINWFTVVFKANFEHIYQSIHYINLVFSFITLSMYLHAG